MVDQRIGLIQADATAKKIRQVLTFKPLYFALHDISLPVIIIVMF
jgi:hypothetical protein